MGATKPNRGIRHFVRTLAGASDVPPIHCSKLRESSYQYIRTGHSLPDTRPCAPFVEVGFLVLVLSSFLPTARVGVLTATMLASRSLPTRRFCRPG